ncbi:hypothetical protein [Halorubrum sp. Atlit-28R]|uniref:hypothetical protein n=1 Tax=Halorubrum sp. Atlit-28R TaxID=2282129 RepID=UPI0011C44341|nr:hypothetical protein [Halorubrum sp. Atlit-28R]
MRRRKFARSVGGIGTLGVLGVSSVNADETSPTVKELGLTDKIRELHLEGEPEKASKLLEKNNVKQSTQSRSGSALTDDSSEGDVSPDGHYSSPDGDTEFNLNIAEFSGEDRYVVTGSGTLADRVLSVRDAALVPDALGLLFDTNEWTVDPDFDIENATAASSDAGGASASVATIELNRGTGIEVELPDLLNEPTTVTSQIVLEKTGTSESAPVALEYEHTWTGIDTPQPISIGLGVSASISTLEVDLTNSSVNWALSPPLTTGPN